MCNCKGKQIWESVGISLVEYDEMIKVVERVVKETNCEVDATLKLLPTLTKYQQATVILISKAFVLNYTNLLERLKK